MLSLRIAAAALATVLVLGRHTSPLELPAILQENPSAETGRDVRPGVYVPPNEQHPAVAVPILARSNHGVYVSVGGERSFMGAAVTKSQALLVVDYDPEIIRFTEINRALLAASRGREDYLVLRLKAGADVWRQRAPVAPREDRNVLTDPQSWKFWEQTVRNNPWAWSNAFAHFHTAPKSPDDPFAQFNYLFDEGLYEHLHRLARNSLIQARLLDLRHEKEVRQVCQVMRAKGWRLGVVDTSNVPYEQGTAATGRYVAWLSECAEGSTIFMNTEVTSRVPVSYWTYFAFTGKVLRKRDAGTIARWYDFEIRKFRTDPEAHAVLDDPDALSH